MRRLDRAGWAAAVIAIGLIIMLLWTMAACRRVRRQVVREAEDRMVEKAVDVLDGAERGAEQKGGHQ